MNSLFDIEHSSSKSDQSAARRRAWIGARLRVFRRDEEGSMIVMTMFIFMFMMVMAGLGIDTMRHEMERARLQATLDSAVLAGAKAPFGKDPEVIVKDYFAKADMSKYLNPFKDGDIVNTLNASKVYATASMTMDTYLMKLSGVDSLSANAAATAETRIPKLEVALVLDVSGSMSGQKIQNLRSAAKTFVTTILNSGDPGAISVAVVPFSTSVTPSDEMFESLFVDEVHEYSTCIALDDEDFNSTGLVTDTDAENDGSATPLRQNIYTSLYGGFENLDWNWRSCMTDEAFRIMPFSASETDLHTKIDTLPASGTTTGDMGIKWGAAMLDPSFRSVTADLITSGTLPASMANTPVDYATGDTMKVIVMMGDGENVTSYFFAENSAYRGDLSDMFNVEYQDEILDYAAYIYDPTYRLYGPGYEYLCDYWWWDCEYKPVDEITSAYHLRHPTWVNEPGLETTAETAVASVSEAGPPCASLLENHFNGTPKNNTGAWQNHECGAAVDAVLDSFLDDYWYYDLQNESWMTGTAYVDLKNSMSGFISRTQLPWEDAWSKLSPYEFSRITGDWAAYNEYFDNGITGAEKNIRMDNVCTAAKNNNITIYTIGYMVEPNGTAEQSLKKCATGYDAHENASSYYYDVKDVDISTAFSSIAGSVQTLRLTQ